MSQQIINSLLQSEPLWQLHLNRTFQLKGFVLVMCSEECCGGLAAITPFLMLVLRKVKVICWLSLTFLPDLRYAPSPLVVQVCGLV